MDFQYQLVIFSSFFLNSLILLTFFNNTARTVLRHTVSVPYQQLCYHLHWLPLSFCINYKIATLTYTVVACNQPLYLSHSLFPYTPAHTLHSQDKHLFTVPTVSTVTGRRGFSYTMPSIWNEIHLKIRNGSFLASFKKQLKNTLFYLCLPLAPPHHLPPATAHASGSARG